LNEWIIEGNEKWTHKASKIISEQRAKEAYFMAVESMSTLNKNGAQLMKKYGCHGATDVTGFGLLGHAENLVTV
jgi:selenide, water dikinase